MSRDETAAWIPVLGGAARREASAAAPPAPIYPDALARLLGASAAGQGEAWAGFLAEYSRLLLHAVHSVSASRDEAMDAYAHVLDRLRDEDFRRLRAYASDPRSRFTTWLVVVARRLCVDLYRARHGRDRPRPGAVPQAERRLRRRLADLAGADVDLNAVADEGADRADARVAAAELHGALAAAVQALPTGDQLLLKLRFDDALSASQIARAIRLPSPFHVYRRLNAVLAGLRVALRGRGIDGPSA